MNLLQQLSEAANIPVDELRDKMRKDPRIKSLFNRDFSPFEIKDPEEFVTTLNFYFFNNRNVQEYVKSRADVNKVSSFQWKNVRSVTPSIIKSWFQKIDGAGEKFKIENYFATAKAVITSVFFDLAQSTSKHITRGVLDDLQTAAARSNYNRDVNLTLGAIDELSSLNFKEDKKIRLYRGVLFDVAAMTEVGKSFTSISQGTGVKFLKSIREGTRVANLEWDNPTMWTKNLEMAVKAATKGYRYSSSEKNNKVESPNIMGFVISTLADPDDVLFDFSVATKTQPEWIKPESDLINKVILKKGKKLCRVVHKFTREGEVDPIARDEETKDTLDEIGESLEFFKKILKIPLEPIHFSTEHFRWANALKETPETYQKLIDPELKPKLMKLVLAITNYYKKHIEPLDIEKLGVDAGPEHSSAITAIKKLKSVMNEQRIISDVFKNPPHNRFGRVSVAELDATSVETLFDNDLVLKEIDDFLVYIKSGKRFTQSYTGSIYSGVANSLTKAGLIWNNGRVFDIHRRGQATQQEILNKLPGGFLRLFGIPEAPGKEANLKAVRDVLSVATHNSKALILLHEIKNALPENTAG